MDYVTATGLIAGIITTSGFLPQVIKTWKTKSTKDISLGMFSLFTVGIALWLIYGIFLNELPIILANAVSLVLALILIGFKLKYK